MTTRTWPAPKDPDEIKEYELLWHLLLKDDTIAGPVESSVWVIVSSNSGLSITDSSKTGTTTTVWLSGGRVGTYELRNTIITAAGRTYDQTVRLNVKNK